MFDLRFLSGFLAIPWFNAACSSSPDLVGEFDDHAQFRPLLFLGQDVAFLGRGEAALRRQAELLERSEFARFLDAALDIVLLPRWPTFGVKKPGKETLLPLGRKRSGSKPPARSVSYSR